MDERARPRVAASECLLGRRVRWDGDHNGDAWPLGVAGRLFELVGFCPEVGIGMGVPRPPIQLVGAAPHRAVAVQDASQDFTQRLRRHARRVAPLLAGVHGCIFADRSPSCGLAGVKVFAPDGSFRRSGRGVFAAAVVAARPDLPTADAETLLDAGALCDFARRVAAHAGVPFDAARFERARTGP